MSGNHREPAYLFDPERLIGTVVEVGPDYAKVNLPLAAHSEPQLRHGARVGAGEVGEFVIVEAGDVGVLARITHVRIPERDRLAVEPAMPRTDEPHPLGTLQLLCTVWVSELVPERAIVRYPRIGARVYSLDTRVLADIAGHAGRDGARSPVRLPLARLQALTSANIEITPERLFGRHCAILGATGGGKSWTLAGIVEWCARFSAKVLLIDATGEYHQLNDGVEHVSLGSQPDEPSCCPLVSLPYRELVEEDLIALFRPSGQSQGPKLREAMKSLKLAQMLGADSDLVVDGCIPKANRPRHRFEQAYSEHAADLHKPAADFAIEHLVSQIERECVWPNAKFGSATDDPRWGDTDQSSYGYCIPLINRIETYITAPEFAPIFRPGETRSVFDAIERWLNAPEPILRISLRHLPFANNVREIIANGLARRLLERARERSFESKPLVVCLDEAHQFLGKSLGDEYVQLSLDAFELIAKEGRKYSLNLCLATQRPRDVPEAVLGQMGTLIVHRLTHDGDRRMVERAASDLDRSAAAFLPALAPGEALLLGADIPIPLAVKIVPPRAEPDSRGPDYQQHWQRREPVEPTEPVPDRDTRAGRGRAKAAAAQGSTVASNGSDLSGTDDEPEPRGSAAQPRVEREEPAVE